MLFVCYPKCSTCKKAMKWLDDNGFKYDFRDIREDNPKAEELKIWIEKSGLDIKKFFNTSGIIYRENKIKNKLPNMTDEEKIKLLATDGMLVKRPLLITDDKVLLGFKEKEYEEKLK